MKITNSSIAMAATHHETSFIYKESMTIEAAKSGNVAGGRSKTEKTGKRSPHKGSGRASSIWILMAYDEAGNDYLIDLKKADVGAIYLSNADTQFSLKDVWNNLDAEIKRTGIYLRESTGVVGTLNHVDLAI